jgi:hypoxanthine phosphoribosyltransferase/membrane-associated phospholipid phosphatase
MKLNTYIKKLPLIFCIFVICLYHFTIQNGLEKIFFETYFDYHDVKRPLLRCASRLNGQNTSCIGMPSGHAETITLLTSLLYLYKFIPFWACLLLIFCFSGQRIISNMHTLYQVIAGIFIGYRYALIYKYFDLSIYSFLIIFIIGLLLALLCIYKIDKQIYGPIPQWVNTEMIESIKKKQNAPLYSKIVSIYANAIIQDRTHISWPQLGKYLDIIIERIKQTGQQYNAVVGIKTGGAIISDYISQKLELPNYKVKLSRSEYNCNKQPYNLITDIINKNVFHNYGKYTVCEGIDDNLQGKNVILVDELVSSGKTMCETYKYLKNIKNVNNIYSTSIALYKQRYKGDININYVLPNTVVIWPWGYDN